MLESARHSRFRIPMDRLLVSAVMALFTVATLGTVALLAMGRLGVINGIYFVAVPWVLLAAAFRPDWLLLGFIAMPATVTADLQPRRVIVLVGAALVMLLVTRRKFSLGWGTGLAALLIINGAAHVFQAQVGPDAIASNQGAMLNLTLFILLALLAFNLAVLGELDGGSLGTALVIGMATTLVVGSAGYGGVWFESGPGIITRTYLAPMMAAALGVTLARIFMVKDVPTRRLGNLLMSGILLWLIIASETRATWLAVIITFGLLAFQRGRRGYVLILTLVIALALVAPVARQAITRSESGDIAAGFESGDITTGRARLWTALWERAHPAFPWGHGFGYMGSLSSEDLFGQPGDFPTVSGVVSSHNDFIYLLVEFGIPGLLLVILFWVGLFRARRAMIRSADLLFRRSGWLLLGVTVSGLTVAFFDNLFLIRPIAERFIPVYGFMFGLAEVERARRRERSRLESLSTTEALRRH
jgi:O-antigen ligase